MYKFKADENALTRRMAEGHRIRKGHTLTGVWVYGAPGWRELQRTCCK